MSNLLIDCQSITKSYQLDKVEIPVLKELNLQVFSGEYAAILGPSGSGKSTLMHILGCLDQPTTGNYYLDGKETSRLSRNELAMIRNQKIGFIFQSFHLLAHATTLENATLPLLYRGLSFRVAKQRAEKELIQVGLGDRLKHLPAELSGGQRQRVAIARALVTDPQLILADEPTGNLDTKTGQEIMALFEGLNQQGKTFLIVTHDLNLAHRMKRIIPIQDGQCFSPSAINQA